jgi:flagellar biosynthesis regulator FlaF
LNMAAQMSMKHQRFRDKYTKGSGNAVQHEVKCKFISVGFWVNVSKTIRQRFSKVRLNCLLVIFFLVT